jgi:hypothetical protein
VVTPRYGKYSWRLADIVAGMRYPPGMDFRRPLQTVTATLDGDVLNVLARADVEMAGREIHRMAGRGSHQGIRNAADRLTAQGVLRRRAVGGAHLYRLNRDHLAAVWIEGLAGLAAQLVDRLRSEIATWSRPPAAAVLFGSVATGMATSDSDLDLMVVRADDCDVDEPGWRAQLAALEEHASAWSGNDARILEYGRSEAGATHTLVLRGALKDGIALYGSQRVLRELAQAGLDR